MANDKPGLRNTFKTRTPYSGKIHYDKMSAAQLNKMMISGKAMLDKLKARKKTPPRRKPKRPL